MPVFEKNITAYREFYIVVLFRIGLYKVWPTGNSIVLSCVYEAIKNSHGLFIINI